MEKNLSKRRETIKNITILFLIVMLLLTFFSNTIMNYSLPEVMTQGISSGTITAKIRGTGMAKAKDPYQLILTESHKIIGITLEEGDIIEENQVLFYLEEKESEELKEEEDKLEELMLSYEKTLLSGEASNNVLHNIESGINSPLSNKQFQVQDIQNKVVSAEAEVTQYKNKVNALQKQVELLQNGSIVDSSGEKKALIDAQSELASAQSEYNVVKEKLNTLQSSVNAIGSLEFVTNKVDKCNSEVLEKEIVKVEKETAWNNVKDDPSIEEDVKDSTKKEYTNAVNEYDAAVVSLEGAKILLEDFNRKASSLAEAQKNAEGAKEKVASYENKVNEKQKELDLKMNVSNIGNITAAKNQLVEEKDKLSKAEANLLLLKSQENQTIKNVISEVDITSQKKQIEEQKKVIENIKEKAIGNSVSAPVSGIISEISYLAGEVTEPNKPLAVIQQKENGYSLSFSVTMEQAKKVKIGNVAEINNNWYGTDIQATLTSIKTDVENPAKNKVLTFDISGDVQDGQSVSLSVFQQEESFDMVVPNSAVREDNRGKFVLSIESNQTPFGNRYLARRVDVKILGSDDNFTAIGGILYGNEYIITTATKPVEDGMQVKLMN